MISIIVKPSLLGLSVVWDMHYGCCIVNFKKTTHQWHMATLEGRTSCLVDIPRDENHYLPIKLIGFGCSGVGGMVHYTTNPENCDWKVFQLSLKTDFCMTSNWALVWHLVYLFHYEMSNKLFEQAADNTLPTDLALSSWHVDISYLPSANKQSQAYEMDLVTFITGAFVHISFLQVQCVPPIKQWHPLWDHQGLNVTLVLLLWL